jgi:hypothetical protein
MLPLWSGTPTDIRMLAAQLSILVLVGAGIAIVMRCLVLEHALAQSSCDEAERFEALHQLQADFIATVSHDLRTPLVAVGAGLSVLQSSVADRLREDERRLFENGRHGSDRLCGRSTAHARPLPAAGKRPDRIRPRRPGLLGWALVGRFERQRYSRRRRSLLLVPFAWPWAHDTIALFPRQFPATFLPSGSLCRSGESHHQKLERLAQRATRVNEHGIVHRIVVTLQAQYCCPTCRAGCSLNQLCRNRVSQHHHKYARCRELGFWQRGKPVSYS